MLFRQFCSFIFLLISFFAIATDDGVLKIQGQVFDAETNEPLPFAHVAIGETRTITNVDGEFSISVPEVAKMEISVSFIGYKTFKSPIEADEKQFNITLSPAATELAAVTVTTGESIIEKVFNKLRLNYELDQQHMVCYYKESLMDTKKMYYLAEGILDVYQPSEISSEPIEISPIRTRKKEFKQLDEEAVLIHGHASDMLKTIVRREKSFVNIENLKHYIYHYEGVSEYDGKEIFILSFEPKTKKATSKGNLFVDAESYAIVKAEYFPLLGGNKFWDQVSWIEEFSRNGVMWNVNRVSYSGKWTIDNVQYSYSSTLVVNESRVVRVPPALGLLLGDKDVFYNSAKNFSEDFWEGYTYVKLNADEKRALESRVGG